MRLTCQNLVVVAKYCKPTSCAQVQFLACVSNVLRKDVQVNSMVIADVCVRVDSRLVIVVDDQYSQLLIQFRNWYVGKAATTGITLPIVLCNCSLLRKTPFLLIRE
jgi:hypothetical protein